MALGDIDVHFVWPGVALMALGWLWWRAWVSVTPPHFVCEASRNSFTHLTSTCISCTSHTHPLPSLFSFLPFPSHFHLSLDTYWKKLTCGVIRSFSPYWSHRPLLPFAIHWHPCWPWILRKLLGAMVRMVEIKPFKISG